MTAVVPVTVNVVPKLPEMVIVLAALLATPVPPLTGDKTPVKLVIVLDEILTKSLNTEFQAIIHFSPLITVTPVVGPVTPRTVILWPPVVELLTTYILLMLGTLTFLSAILDPVKSNCMYWAVVPTILLPDVEPVVWVSVTSASVVMLLVPATEISM